MDMDMDICFDRYVFISSFYIRIVYMCVYIHSLQPTPPKTQKKDSNIHLHSLSPRIQLLLLLHMYINTKRNKPSCVSCMHACGPEHVLFICLVCFVLLVIYLMFCFRLPFSFLFLSSFSSMLLLLHPPEVALRELCMVCTKCVHISMDP